MFERLIIREINARYKLSHKNVNGQKCKQIKNVSLK